jgi:hypothetical protein
MRGAKVAIFGTHTNALEIKHELSKRREDIEIVCSLDTFRQGEVEGLPVYSPRSINESVAFDVVLLVSQRHQSEMRETLVELGVENEKIIDVY